LENWKDKFVSIFYSNVLNIILIFFLNREYCRFQILKMFDIPSIKHGMGINRMKEVCGAIKKIIYFTDGADQLFLYSFILFKITFGCVHFKT